MSNFSDDIDEVREQLEELDEALTRHRRVVDSIDEDPDEYEDDAIDSYLSDLKGGLADLDFLPQAQASLAELEQAVDAAEEKFLEGARVEVDGEEIDEAELRELVLDSDPPRATMLVPSPVVNRLRGGTKFLELSDGRRFDFTIEKTLIAEVEEDKSGFLQLDLSLQPLD